MGLETTVNYVFDLNQDWPLPADPKSAGDDHIRFIKKALRQSFPNINGPMPVAHDQVASKNDIAQAQFQTVLPAQPGGTVRYDLTSLGGAATWQPRSLFANPDKLAEAYAIALAI